MALGLTKNKNIVYILLPCVVVVWGLIINKIIGNQTPNEDYISSVIETKLPSIKDAVRIEHSELDLNYKDPFLGAIIEHKYQPVTVIDPVSDVTITKNRWPIVIYQGCVRDDTGELAYVDIDETVYLAGIEKLPCNVSILRIYSDSVQLQFNNEIKWFKK